MKLIRKIQKLNDDELEIFVQRRINLLENKQKHLSDTIGFLLDYNQSVDSLLLSDYELATAEILTKFDGYIPLGTRMVYGMNCDTNKKIVSNGGKFYYIDTDDYILDFCKYIKEQEIIDEFELFDCILDFIDIYFGTIPTINREEMIQLISKDERTFFDPIKAPVFSSFKKKGNHQCSEIGIVTQNILSFLGYDISLIIGNQQLDEEYAHAFNLIDFNYQKTKLSLLLDMASSVYITNLDHQTIGIAPYIHYLDKNKEETFQSLIDGTIDAIECPDYNYILVGKNIWKEINQNNRYYSIYNESNNKRLKKTINKN